MSMATYQADGVSPLAAILHLSRRLRAELIAAAQVIVVAGAATVLCLAAAHDARPPAPLAEAAPRSQYAAPVALNPAAPALGDGYSRPMLQALLTKAGLRPNYDLRRLDWDQARRVNAAMPVAAVAREAARPFTLSVDTKDGREALHCLTQAAYFEAGNSGVEAEAGVVQVALNRVRHPDFPKSVCGVVYQGAARQTGCQFTFTCDGALKRALDPVAWNQARAVATRALAGYVDPAVGSATYYHADYVFPAWAPTLVKVGAVGPHIFYRLTGPAGDAAALTGRYAGGELKVSRAVLAAIDGLSQKVRQDGAVKLAATQAVSTTEAALKPALSAPAERIRMRIAAMQMQAGPEPKPEAPAAPVASTETASPAA